MSGLSAEEKDVVLQMVFMACSEDPSITREIIDAATDGVKKFADSQNDRATQCSFKLYSVLDEISRCPESFVPTKFGPFSREEVVNTLSGCFEGTTGLKQLREKFGVKQPPDDNKPAEENKQGWK